MRTASLSVNNKHEDSVGVKVSVACIPLINPAVCICMYLYEHIVSSKLAYLLFNTLSSITSNSLFYFMSNYLTKLANCTIQTNSQHCQSQGDDHCHLNELHCLWDNDTMGIES